MDGTKEHHTYIPTHNSKNVTPKPMKSDATRDTNNSFVISLVNFVDVTSYLVQLR